MRPAPIALLALMLASPAAAQGRHVLMQEPPPEQAGPAGTPNRATIIVEPVGMMIAAFDSDGDGRVTRAEFDAGVKHSFDVVDTGHSGTIGYIAFSDWSKRWLGDENALPSALETDRNGDNHITPDELATRFDLYFTQYDKNHDQVIDRSELVSVRTGGMGWGGGRRHGRPPEQ